MKKTVLAAVLALMAVSAGGQTLEECQEAAERNYPLIREYDLIGQTTAFTVENIGKGWLPQISAQAQATLQSDVTAWPDQMQAMIGQMGVSVKGLRKDQYRVGVDVSQTVYDGGNIRSLQEVARRQGDVEAAQTAVSLYAVRQRVNEMYFALLLLDDQLQLNADHQELLAASEKKLASMLRHGTAAESDYNAVKAERLTVQQQAGSLQSQRRMLALMLSTFCGLEVTTPTKPPMQAATASPVQGQRPELLLADARISLADAQEKALDAALKPRLGVFAQGFYGYPGYNMFEDMMRHRWSLNGMIGARLTWNIGALYTRRGDKAKLQLQRQMAETSREVFLFNNRLEQLQQSEEMERYRQQMAADEEIIGLRQKVRKAAESKLSHGIIDVNDLLKEINAENAARLQQSMHEVEMLKECYDLKITTNN